MRNKLFKRVLAVAMASAVAVTSVPSMAFAAEIDVENTEIAAEDVAEVAVEAETESEEYVGETVEAPVPVAEYGFEDTLQNSASEEKDEVTPLAFALGSYNGEVAYTDGRREGTKALKLGNYGIQLNKKNIGKNFTVSAWVKSDSKTLAENQNVMFLGYHNPENWVGIVGLNGSQRLKIWTRQPAVSEFNGWITLNDTQTLPQGEWHCFTIVQEEGGQTSAYKDGEKVFSAKAAQALDGANQDVYIGVNNWDKLFAGAVDDVKVYDRALTSDEVYDYCYDPEKPVISDEAIEIYDFKDFAAAENDAATLTDGTRNVSLVTVGNGTAPVLVEDADRGQVLKTTAQGVGDHGLENIGYALLPANPFEGKSVENGLTLNFWANTQETPEGGRTLIDFELAPGTGTGDPDRAGTFAFNQRMVYWNTTSQNGNFTDFNIESVGLAEQNVWKMVTMTVTKNGINFYSNGKPVGHTVQSGAENYETMINDLAGNSDINTEGTKVRLGASMANYWIGAGSLLDDIGFFGRALTAQEVAALYDETAVTDELTDITISGASLLQMDETAQLTAELIPADATGRSDIRWTSSDDNVVKVDKDGLVHAVGTGKATVTARIGTVRSNKLEIEVQKIEDIKELKEGYWLAVYSTTTPFYASAARVDQETQSVYMAVSKDGKSFEVLNNGGGVIFSSNTKGTLRITNPKIYKDGNSYTVIAQDADKNVGYHVFTSQDGVKYYDDTIEEFPSQISGALDKASFTLNLDGENILETDQNITLGNAVELTAEEYKYITDKLGTVVNTTISSPEDITLTVQEGEMFTEKTLAKKAGKVTAGYSDGSTQEFDVDWSNALEGKDLSQPGTYELTGKVKQVKYLNNLKALNGSTLPEDDPENESAQFPGNYDPATGTVYYDETKFVEGMADPMVYWDAKTGYYYMTGSYFPEDQDAMEGETPDQYDRVVLRRGKTLEELQDRSKQVTIWKVGNQGFENRNGNAAARGYRYIWAPEIHRVGDNWVVYFTESHSSNLFDIYSHALVLDGDKDPYETALKSANEASQWKDYQMRGGSGLTKSITSSFCLDMTYFKDAVNEERYVVWASKGYGNSRLYMAKVDVNEPWKLTSEIIELTRPEYGWENVRYDVNEGATVLQRDGKIFLCYSASGTGSEYAIGMLTAEAGTDLLAEGAWTKSPYPLLTSRDVDGEEGPGHNSFTVDENGNAIFVYHARPTSHNYKKCGWDGTNSSYNGEPLNDPCRHARFKRVHWAADGTPILKMTYADELLEENQTVTVKVTVSGEVTEGNLRDYATPSVSHIGWNMGAEYFADDDMNSFWNGHNDPNLQTSDQWMMYDFGDQKAEISACAIKFYWAGDNGVITPNGVIIECEDENGEWVKVTPANEWTCKSKAAGDDADVFEFEPVETSKIRVTMDHGKLNDSKVAVAVFDWKLTGKLVKTVNKKVLREAVAAAISADKKDDYTAETWAPYEEALNTAKALIENKKATQEAVNAAAEALKTAQGALVLSPADKTALQAAVDAAAELNAADYTEDSWKAFEDALNAVKDVLAKDDATQKEANEVLAALAEAKDALESVGTVDKSKLQTALDDAESLKEEDYTAESWKSFASVLEAAKGVLAKENVAQKEVDEAVDALSKAVAALKKAERPEIDKGTEIAYFDFESKNEDGTFNGGKYAVGTVTGTLEPQEAEGYEGHFLNFDGKSSIKVTDKDGGSLLTGNDEITFSFDMKPTAGASAGWPFFANYNDGAPVYQKERYLGCLIPQDAKSLSVERYLNGRGAEGSSQTTAITNDKWTHVDVVFDQEGTKIYLDNELASKTACASSLTEILGDGSTIYIGRSLWGEEYYSGLMDNLGIYAKGTAKSLKISGKTELAKAETTTLTVEATPLHVTNMDALTWSSSDEKVATVKDGVVTAVAAGKATITAAIGEISGTAEITVSGETVNVDKTTLQEAVEAAIGADKKDDYTAESWTAYEKALKDANDMLAKEDATQEAVDAAAAALKAAQEGLVKAEKPIEIPEVLADFDFDDEETGLTSAYGKAAGNHELKDSYAASAGKALYLDGTNFLNVTNKDGGSLLTGVKDLTVSFEMKSDRTGIANWPFYAAPNGDTQKYEQEHYIGLLETSGALKAERYNGGPRAQSNEATASSTDWFRVDLVYAETGTELYVNGEKQGETVASTFKLADILGDSSILQIGKANWESGEYFKGWIDNFKIVSKALTAEEIKANADAFLKAKPADKTALEKKVKAAISADKKDEYTPETWKAYEDALNAAKAVIEKADATQTEVDEALKTLTDAQRALKKATKPTPVPVDKKALQTAVDEAAALKAADYTAESWAALQTALKDAQVVLDKSDAAQADVDAAVKAVDAAVKALVKATQPKPPVDKIDHTKHIGMTFYAGDLKYKITKDDGKVQEVRVTSLKNKKATKVVIPKKVTCKKLGETFKVTSIKAKAFKGKNIKKAVIGANVTKIGPNAFLNCKKLTTVTIGKSVKSIGTRAFYGCAKLTKVTIKSKVVKTVKKNAFKRISRKAVIKVPKGKKTAYTRRFKGRIAKGVKIK